MGSILVSLTVVPVLFLIWVRSISDTPEDLADAAPSPVLVQVGQGTTRDERPVGLLLTWSGDGEVLAPAWHGTVVDLNVGIGDRVVSGDVIAAVDGVGRIAWAAAIPPYRSLSLTAKGEDVADLQVLLSDPGFYSGDMDGSYGRATESAVADLQEALGVDKPDGVFAVDTVVWMPFEPFEVHDVFLAVGL